MFHYNECLTTKNYLKTSLDVITLNSVLRIINSPVILSFWTEIVQLAFLPCCTNSNQGKWQKGRRTIAFHYTLFNNKHCLLLAVNKLNVQIKNIQNFFKNRATMPRNCLKFRRSFSCRLAWLACLRLSGMIAWSRSQTTGRWSATPQPGTSTTGRTIGTI